jgi:hypothetical protein
MRRLGLPLGRTAQEHAQVMHDGFEAFSRHPAPHLLIDHRPRWQVVRQHAPVDASLY